jgi:glycosyltransferase involved in cell wall biosynthesis
MMNLINGFAREGVEVHVLVPRGDYPELGGAMERAVAVHQDSLATGREALDRLRAVWAELEPRVVLSNRDDTNALVVAARQGLATPPRVVLRVGIDIPAKLRHQNLLSRWRRRRRLRRTYRGADLLIGNSEGVSRGLRAFLGRNAPPIETVYNPLDLEHCRRQARQEPDHPWFRRREGPLLVSVGRLARMKDQATMLRAFALLPTDARLVIFGEGRQRDQLLTLARELGVAERFDLPGHTDNPFSHVARADVFVLSSRFEGSPNALLESLAVGTPAISTDCPSGPREILADGRFGALVPVASPGALADAVLETLERPPTGALLEEAVARFDHARAVHNYLRLMGLEDSLPAAEPPR